MSKCVKWGSALNCKRLRADFSYSNTLDWNTFPMPPLTMPDNLRAAHARNDEVLERIYIGRRFKNDTERLEKLFELYTAMTDKTGKAAKVAKASKGKTA
jgi:hypothetical protein